MAGCSSVVTAADFTSSRVHLPPASDYAEVAQRAWLAVWTPPPESCAQPARMDANCQEE
jgi:hypothetical protein